MSLANNESHDDPKVLGGLQICLLAGFDLQLKQHLPPQLMQSEAGSLPTCLARRNNRAAPTSESFCAPSNASNYVLTMS